MIAEQIAVLTSLFTEGEQGSTKPDPLVSLKSRELI